MLVVLSLLVNERDGTKMETWKRHNNDGGDKMR